METLTQSQAQQVLKKLPKLLAKKQRIQEFEKKRLFHAKQNADLKIREEVCVARQVMMYREKQLSTVAKENLPQPIDKMLRERAERRQAAKKSSM